MATSIATPDVKAKAIHSDEHQKGWDDFPAAINAAALLRNNRIYAP